MEPLWEVKGFEQHIMNARVPECVFSWKNEEHSDTDIHMPSLVHERTLFFPLYSPSRLFSLLFRHLSSLSFCICLRVMDVTLVLCLVCVWVLGEGGTVCTSKTPSVSRFKTSPCMLVRVLPVHTGTPHTPQPRPRTQPHTTQTTHNTPHRSKEKRRRREKQREDEREVEREEGREDEREDEEKIKEIKRKWREREMKKRWKRDEREDDHFLKMFENSQIRQMTWLKMLPKNPFPTNFPNFSLRKFTNTYRVFNYLHDSNSIFLGRGN